ncbi:MAG: hypothetical protein AB7L09_21180 [Nitrospira sp.]
MAGAKRIRVSPDNGSNWYTLPGNQGELRNEAGQIVDTIFGQSFESNQPGLIVTDIMANGLFKGFAGYVAVLKQSSGAAVAMNDEATTLLSGKTYQITNAAHRIIDRATAIVVEDNATPVAASNIESIDYLFGRVTFISSYTPTGPITITGAYRTTSVLAKGRSFNLTQTQEPIDTSVYETVQANGGYKTWDYGLRTCSLEFGGVFDAANDYIAQLVARGEAIIDITPDGGGQEIFRGFFRPVTQSQQGNVGELEEETVNFNCSVPDTSKLLRPVGWVHAGATTLNAGVRASLDAWENGTTLDVQYLPNGEDGWEFEAIVAECTLQNSLEGMNEFTLNYRINAAAVEVSDQV